MKGRPMTKATTLAVAALATGAIVGSSMLAGANQDSTVISACYSKRTGALRVASERQCRTSESAIHWNQAGPPGPIGPEGPSGPGLTGIEQISVESEFDSEEPKTIAAECPANKIVLTGGARVASDFSFPQTAAAYLTWSAPLATLGRVVSTSWVARAGEPTPSDRDWSVVAWVWCVDDPTP